MQATDVTSKIEVPCLANDYELRLHFNVTETCRIKCHPLNVSEEFSDINTIKRSSDEVHFVDLSEEDVTFRNQSSNGALVDVSAYTIFRARSYDIKTLGVGVTVYRHDTNAGPDEPHPVIGQVSIPPTMLCDNSFGNLNLDVLIGNNNKSVGPLSVDYLIIKPTEGFVQRRDATPLTWDMSQRQLDMGHRGMGKCRSKKVPPYVLENTIKCFNMAADHGADYVEFDVQVTKDNVVVVFHDFVCRLPASNKDQQNGSTEPIQRDIPVTDFTYEELHNLKAGFAVDTETDKIEGWSNVDQNSEQLFPKLKDVFHHVAPDMGFNIEIKFPTLLKSGEPEDGLAVFRDMNEYVDIILCDIQKHAGDRKIVLSCFNPDVCTMLKLKQNQYPVLFLTQGEVKRYAPFFDRRTRDVPIAIKFAKAEGLLGVNPISEYILQDFSLVKQATDLGLIFMCWGVENNDPVVIKALKKNSVHVVIYDRLNEFIDSSKARKVTS